MFFKKAISFSILITALTASLTQAQSGWKPEEPIAFSSIDPRVSGMQFDNLTNKLFSFWDGDGGVGGGFSVRPHLGPVGFRSGPSSSEYLTLSVDGQGNALAAHVTSARKINAGIILAGNTFISKIQDLGLTVPYAAGRKVDVHFTKNGLGAIIWLDNLGRPNVAFRGSGVNAEFDISNKALLDGPPSSSAGSVFIARDIDGGAFAMWRKDNQWKQAYYNPQTATFDVQNFNLVVPIGDPPALGKVNSGSVFSFEVNKNSSGDVTLAYSIYTSVLGQSVAPHGSISLAYAYRKRSTPVFGVQSFNKNPDDFEDNFVQVAVLPDGRAVVSWIRSQTIPNPCPAGPGNIGGAYINGSQQFRSIISDENGNGWQGLYSMDADPNSTFISFPTEIGVADGRVIFGIEKSIMTSQCMRNTLSTEFNIINALWPSDKPMFTNVGSAVTVPGLNGFVNGVSGVDYFGDLASIGVSDIGTVAVLAAKRPKGSFDETPSLFVWESGLQPGASNSNPGGQPTPTSTDACPNDTNKSAPGICGCGFEELDSNGDAVVDCGSPGNIYTKGSILSNPPKVESNGKNLSLIMQIYEQIISGAVPAKKGGNKVGGKTPKITAVYEITAQLQGSKVKCGKVKLESKKNTAQLKNLINGTYDISYKMTFKQGDKKIGSTSQSPIATGVITQGKTKCPTKKKK